MKIYRCSKWSDSQQAMLPTSRSERFFSISNVTFSTHRPNHLRGTHDVTPIGYRKGSYEEPEVGFATD